MTIKEYVTLNPESQVEPELERRQRLKTQKQQSAFRDLQKDKEEVSRLKTSIAQQLEEGAAPEIVLYTALKALSLATHDNVWHTRCLKVLDSVYDGLWQVSLLADDSALANQRLEELQTAHAEKVLKKLNTVIKSCEAITKSCATISNAAQTAAANAEKVRPFLTNSD